MNPNERRAFRAHQSDVKAATSRFEQNPLYAGVMVNIDKRGSVAAQEAPEECRILGTDARMELILKVLDIAADEYLRLVVDVPSQKDFITIIEQHVRHGWYQFTGHPYELHPLLDEDSALRQAKYRWIMRGWEKLSGHHESAPEPSDRPEKIEGTDDEAGRRKRLLADYKAATDNPSNRSIYEAKNSGIHKPEFYEWLNGELPSTSATTNNFEAFLHRKKRPIPKAPKD